MLAWSGAGKNPLWLANSYHLAVSSQARARESSGFFLFIWRHSPMWAPFSWPHLNLTHLQRQRAMCFQAFLSTRHSRQLPVFTYDHVQARLVLNWFVSGSRGNNTTQIEQGDSFTAVVPHLFPHHLVFPSVPGCAWLSAYFLIILLIFLSIYGSSRCLPSLSTSGHLPCFVL